MYMYTLGAERILIKSNIILCLLNLMAWKASWAHRTGENEEEKKDNDNIELHIFLPVKWVSSLSCTLYDTKAL